MKTILVCYTSKKLVKGDVHKYKKYAFNSKSDIKEGDLIDSPNYDTQMRVVKVLDKSFTYYNASTGELNDDFNSTSQWEIRELIIREDTEDVVYGNIVKETKQ